MKERQSGVILNVTGNAAQTHDPEYICGVAGNAALTAFSQSLGSVSPKDGIRVLSINPGPVETERLVGLMKTKAQDRTGSADNWRTLFEPLPFGRACAPAEVGDMIAFLASNRCSYQSGSVVMIDAGLSARSMNF
jgi:NAD(P)-dependent dehydrogenase (short-subunit alcohol dehydrogenase family)